MSRPRIYGPLARDLEDGLRVLNNLSNTEQRMADRMPDALSAANWEATHGESIAWCDTHEREVEKCRRKLLACRGIPLPHFSDRVGDEVVGQVLTHAWEMVDCADMLHVAIGRMIQISRIYGPEPADEVTIETLEEANKPKCQNHLRYGYVTDARGKHPTRVKHKNVAILDTEYRLCEWCEKEVRLFFAVRMERRLPNQSEVRRHAARVGLPTCSIPAPPGDAEDAYEWSYGRTG